MNNLFRNIPKMDEILESNEIAELNKKFSQNRIKESINLVLDETREAIRNKEISEISMEVIVDRVKKTMTLENKASLVNVVNCTGVVLHTNLGRSLLPKEATDGLSDISCGYSNLEFDLKTGKRGSRYSHVEDLLRKLTGAEAAVVVNNNAAAVLLCLNTMCQDKEVIVSRGELVEIGGSFRIPDVMKFSNAHLVEVGTTNKTHLWDYENNITDETAAFMKVHTSNYRIMGFTEETSISELKSLSEKLEIPIIEDLGSGSLVDLSKYGLTKEPTVQDSIKSGADIVTFSGDKMLGGPQIGIIVGKKKYIDKMKKNNLLRALRVDKMTLYTLENLLKIYLNKDKVTENIPVLSMLTMGKNIIEERSNKFKTKFESEFSNSIENENLSIELSDGYSEVGGGSMPLEKLPTKLIHITSKIVSCEKIVSNLRKTKKPIICRIKDENIILDLRTVNPLEEEFIMEGLKLVL